VNKVAASAVFMVFLSFLSKMRVPPIDVKPQRRTREAPVKWRVKCA
jgi:hypothetical protein